MSHSDVYLPLVSSIENCDTSHSSSKEEMEVRFSLTKENRVNQTKISSNSDKEFLPRGVQVKIRTQKNPPVTDCLVFSICVYFLCGNLGLE